MAQATMSQHVHQFVEMVLKLVQSHEMTVTILITKDAWVIEQARSMDGTDQEAIGQQQIVEQNNETMDISPLVSNEKMETWTQVMDVTTELLRLDGHV